MDLVMGETLICIYWETIFSKPNPGISMPYHVFEEDLDIQVQPHGEFTFKENGDAGWQ